MKILLTNDDGILGEGLLHLTNWAKKLGEVTVVAPREQQSGKSHCIEIHDPFEVKEVDYMPGVKAYAVASSPADCVRFALNRLDGAYDLVLSGINRGLNLGEDIVYSGTCGAIFEAAYFSIPAIAFSTVPETFDCAIAHIDEVYGFITEHNLLSLGPLWNVNIPGKVKGIRVTRQGGPYYKDRFIAQGGDLYLADGFDAYQKTDDMTLDTNATFGDYISVCPLTVARTDMKAYEAAAGFGK